MPVISDVAYKSKTPPSKLVISLSYASQFDGILSLVGSLTDTLASGTAVRLSSEYLALHPFDLYKSTILGVIVLVTGKIYFPTIGHQLLPEWVPVEEDSIEEYDLSDYLTEVVVREHSCHNHYFIDTKP